jgi:hypothetical protein
MPRAGGRQDRAVTEAAEALRALVAAVERGEVELANAHDVALLRRLQGALAALETVLGRPTR